MLRHRMRRNNKVTVILSIGIGMIVIAAHSAAIAVTIAKSTFGKLPDGQDVPLITLKNKEGITARIIGWGAALQSLELPNRSDNFSDVVLGYSRLADYLKKPQYFGASVGRFANRIANGRFELDGISYQLTINDGPNSLHGGKVGFDQRLWKLEALHQSPNAASATFMLISANGDQGYPGKLEVWATYRLDNRNRLSITYRAKTNKPTIVNITNHTYWNLAGEGSGSVMGQEVRILGSAYTPTDSTQIPLGVIREVKGTPFDFRKFKSIGKDIYDGNSNQLLIGRGFDENWIVGEKITRSTHLVAEAYDPTSGRMIRLYANQPGLQFYTGNYLNGTSVGTSGRIYRQGDAFVLEPQVFPNAPNEPNFASYGNGVLLPGQTYVNRIVYEFSIRKYNP